MRRREFMGLAAAMPAAAAMPSMAPIHLPSINRRRIPADVEVVYKSPHRQPNALQATDEGLWVLDQRSEGYVSLVNWSDGSLIREFEVSSLDGASGLTVDGNDMWINDNHNSLILRCSTAERLHDGQSFLQRIRIGAKVTVLEHIGH